MRYLFWLLMFLLFLGWADICLGQSVNFEDGFEDGNFTNNPAWSGDTDQFEIIDGDPNHLLQLQGDDENGDISYLSTPSTDVEGSWEFFIDLGFNPSNNNRADIFLMSNIADLEGNVDGYAIRAGENLSDDVFRLVRYENGSEEETILSGTTDISSGGTFRVKVTRAAGGDWTMEVAEGYDGVLEQEGGIQTDNTFSSSSFFGARASYTSSNAEDFTFDFKIDLPPFTVTETAGDGKEVEVTFNRPYDDGTVESSDFSANNELGVPSSITLTDATTVTLNYDTEIPSDRYTLTINDIDDLNGETIDNTTSSFVIFADYSNGDIKINEFMADPPGGQAEYVELINTSDKYLNLADWEIGDETGTDPLGSNPIPLEPNDFIIISPDTVALHNLYGSRPYYEFALANLNNSGDVIELITDSGVQADSLTYDSDWGGNDVALERRSASAPSTYQENWGDSPNPDGGTPGATNEIPEDDAPPQLTELNILSAQILQLIFDERLNKIGSYSITNSSISSANASAPDTVELILESDLQNAQDYTLSVDGAEDIFDNSTSADTSFTYYKPSPADSADIVINEFMYAPPAESSEYIELYNHSDKSLDLKEWTLSDNRENFEGTITEEQFIVPPDSFVVLTPDNTLETTFPNISLIAMSNFPALNNGGDAIVIRSNDNTLLDSLTYTSGWGGDEIALERRSPDVAGSYQSNWGDAPEKLGTPGSPNNITADTEPPTVENLSILNNSELLLTFSEPLDQSTAGNSDNYSLSNTGIDNANFSAPDSIFLSLTSSLQNSTEYILTVENITDLFGNTISPTDTSFTYYEITSADSGDVFINEFSFVPASGSTEFVEIYNPTSESFDLRDWTLSDNRGIRSTITGSQFILPPDSYVVIAPDNTLVSDYPDINLVSMSSFPALNNSGDNIVIHSAEGTLLDSLQFSSEWGGNEVSLERRTTSISGTYPENWEDAPNEVGTPGKANEISVDETPPALEDLWTEDATTLKLLFSENIETPSTTDSQNYQVNPHRDIHLISVRNDTVTLFLSEELESGETYEVTASNISDIFGNTLSEANHKTDFLRIDRPQPGDIVINEIMYKPGTSDADFVELYNASDKNFDLQNWTINDASGGATISQTLQFESGEFLVLTGSRPFAQQADNAYEVDGFPSLNNNIPDDIYLQTQEGGTIDSLRYEQSWGGNIEGTSLERKDPHRASNDASNWQTSAAESGYSAGTQNVSFQDDNDPPELIFSKILPNGNIEAQFNEFIKLTDDVQFLSGDQQLQVIGFDSTRANIVVLSSGAAKSKASNSTSVTVQNLSDVKGNVTSSSEVPVSQPLAMSDLVINEIMFNPLAESDDNRPDQSEYIELRNTRDYAISLEGLVLHDQPDENGEVRELTPVSTTAKWVPPQGQVLVHADAALAFEESQVANFFELEAPDMRSIMRVDRTTLSLASTGDAIYVADSTGSTIDSVFYSEEWHNPNIIDTRGISLERVTPDGPSDDNSNWGSSVNEKGGTPSSENSIYQENADLPQETGISFTPNPFSPDNDGYEDNLFINYKLDHQDYLIDVRVYDRYGRLVRELADGKQAGFEGQLIWDGRKDDNSRNRIGIYIVVFEAYDSSSGADQDFKETVVLARMLN